MITIPILLILIAILGFWIIAGSKGGYFPKTIAVGGFFSYIVVLWLALSSFFGWAADPKYIFGVPVSIYHVIIDEGNQEKDGSIFVLIKSEKNDYQNLILSIFGHPFDSTKPRLYRLDYSRPLHEQLAQEVIPKNQQGQSVRGMFKGDGGEFGKKGKGENSGKGKDSDQSQKQDLRFHNLKPSHEYDKQEERGIDLQEKMKNGEFLG
jgi:hypothetical protein